MPTHIGGKIIEILTEVGHSYVQHYI